MPNLQVVPDTSQSSQALTSVARDSIATLKAALKAARAALETAQLELLPLSPLRFAVVVGGTAAMLGGLWLVFARLKAKNQGFAPNSLKALGLVLFLPVLLISAVAVPGFHAETLAALLGTVGGYVLSHSKSEDEK